MPAPTTSIRLNSTTPAPPSGGQNAIFQSDGGTPQQQITAYDPVMVGDSGSGGTAGNAPAPGAGDAAAGKFLKADGTWSVPSGGGGGGSVQFGSGNPDSAGPGPGAAFVQAASAEYDSCAFASNVTAGNLLIVSFKTEGDPSGISVTDTVGTAYTKLTPEVTGESNNMVVWAGTAATSGANTVTIGSAPASYDQTAVMEVSGCTATIDVSATGFNGTSLSVTTTLSGDFLMLAVGAYHNDSTFTYGGGFTLDAQSNHNDAIAIGHQLATTATTYTGTFSIADGGDDPAILIAFKAATSGPLAGSNGGIYFDTTTTPYTGYVYNASAWNEFN